MAFARVVMNNSSAPFLYVKEEIVELVEEIQQQHIKGQLVGLAYPHVKFSSKSSSESHRNVQQGFWCSSISAPRRS